MQERQTQREEELQEATKEQNDLSDELHKWVNNKKKLYDTEAHRKAQQEKK